MLDVFESTKNLLKSDSVYKEMYVTIENTGSPYIFENEDIYYEAFELKESILDGSDMTFMGCIASEMRITIRNRDNLKDYALNDRKITVEVTPYDRENTKNHMPSLYSGGDSFTLNGVTFSINDDLSVDVSGTATANTSFLVSDFMVDVNDSWLLTGCPSGAQGIQGRLTVYNADTGAISAIYNDTGSTESVIAISGHIYKYEIIVDTGQSVDTTFYPMLRDTTESSEYEPYGTKLIETETIPLFYGYIDSGEYDKDKSWLKLTAYDVMYRLNTFNVWNWYNKIAFTQAAGADNKGQIALDDLLDSFATYVNDYSGFDFSLSSRCPVILAGVKIKKRLKNKEMTATNFLKSFCQLACACAIINREGELQLIYRNSVVTASDTITYYRSLTSKDYIIQPFAEGITIRENQDDDGVTLVTPATDVTTMPTASSANEGRIYHYVGSTTAEYTSGAWYICEEDNGVYEWKEIDWDDDDEDTYIIDDDDELLVTGKYFIENNGIVKKLSKGKRKRIINTLLTYVQNSTYYSFKSYNLECNGLPYVECGDDIIAQTREVTDYEETFTTDTMTINNVNGSEMPVSFVITFNETVQPNINADILVYSNNYDDISTRTPFLGVNLGAVMTLIGDTHIHSGEEIHLSKYNGLVDVRYRKGSGDSVIDYDISSCYVDAASRPGQTYTICDHDQYLVANANVTLAYMNSYNYDITVVATYTTSIVTGTFQSPVVNRTLKGIQSMIDTFSFELPDTTQKYGGTTDKKKIGEPENPGNISPDGGGISPDDLEDITFTQNGLYKPSDYNAMGFNEVTVNVPSGDLGGFPYEAIAVGDIDAMSCVGLIFGSAGQATEIPSNITVDPYFNTDVAYGNEYIYFIPPNTVNIYRIPINNLMATPELYLQTDTSQFYIHRNLACYKKDSKIILEDLNTGNHSELHSYITPIDIGNLLLAQEYFQGIFEDNDPKLYSMKAIKVMDGDYYAGYPTASGGTGFSLLRQYSTNTVKRLYVGTSYYNDVTIDSTGTKQFVVNDTGLVNGYILLKYLDGTLWKSKYHDVGYDPLEYYDTTTQQRVQLVTTYGGTVFQWNAEGTQMFANLGTNGLAVFRSDTDIDIYSNITSIDSATCCMFSHYFWDGKRLWDLHSSNPTMVRTNSKSGGDMLGYVKKQVLNGTLGTAYVLFS